MVAVGQEEVLGSGTLLREQYELKEKCEVPKRGNSEAKNKLPILQVKAESGNSLRDEVDQQGHSSTLAAQIMKLTASLADVEEHRQNDYEEVAKAYQTFEVNRKFLQHKKGDWVNALKILEEEMVVA